MEFMKTVSDSLGKQVWDKRQQLREVNGNAQKSPVENYSIVMWVARFLMLMIVYLVKFS